MRRERGGKPALFLSVADTDSTSRIAQSTLQTQSAAQELIIPAQHLGSRV
jgi:hypothetical protein